MARQVTVAAGATAQVVAAATPQRRSAVKLTHTGTARVHYSIGDLEAVALSTTDSD